MIEEILEKYSDSVLRNLNTDNMNHIIEFLKNNHCDYIEDIIEDYLDLCTIDYEVFIKKFKQLNHQYENKFLNLAKQDMNLLEQFYNDFI